ncbi:MAG: hypothetical protein IKZ02_04640, partial [Alphaproteobacteria bacterium]|nr:hypothetical protein [Alphaproteobacteria bacterium]
MQTKINETGRSMVEMLGVLAVIGVLSVGGIMGYKFGMMKYRVNEIVNELNIIAYDTGLKIQRLEEMTEGEILSEENATLRMGYAYQAVGYADYFELSVLNVPKEDCNQLKQVEMKLVDTVHVEEETAETCGAIVYTIKNDLTGETVEYTDDSGNTDDETPEEDTPTLLNCGMHGRLEGENCVCDTGYTGKLCNRCDTSLGYKTQDAAGNCFTDADCTNEKYCNNRGNNGWGGTSNAGKGCECHQCAKGYWGEHCEFGDGITDVCNGRAYYYWQNGYGSGGGCACYSEYWGTNCEFKKSEKPECNGHGTLYGYGQCLCYEGFSGQYCENEDENTKSCGKLKYDTYGPITGILREINGETWCECIEGWGGED